MRGFLGTGATGLEPATSDVTGRRSNQLSYAPLAGDKEYAKRAEVATARSCDRLAQWRNFPVPDGFQQM
jgi:hypothetical protein